MSLDNEKLQEALPWILAGTAFAGVALVAVAALKTVQKHEDAARDLPSQVRSPR